MGKQQPRPQVKKTQSLSSHFDAGKEKGWGREKKGKKKNKTKHKKNNAMSSKDGTREEVKGKKTADRKAGEMRAS